MAETTIRAKSNAEDSLSKLRAQLIMTHDTKLKKLIQNCIKRIEENKKRR